MRSTLKWILGVVFVFGIIWLSLFHSIYDALALSLCTGGLVWIVLNGRIAALKTRLVILERSEIQIHESVEALYRGETVFQESVEALGQRMDNLHDSVNELYELVDKLQLRVEYHSEWCQSLQERIAVQHNITPDSLAE